MAAVSTTGGAAPAVGEEPGAPGRALASQLRAEHLQVDFSARGNARVRAVDDVSVEVASGEALGIVGESGCGKTTVARCLVGLLHPTSGTVELDGDDLGARRTRQQHRAVQLVFQDPYSSLNPRLAVRTVFYELLALAGTAPADREEKARHLLDMVGLPLDALDRYPSSFSGGQRQRIAIARALAVGPKFVVADEPISALDVSVQASVLELFEHLKTELGLGIVLISHNLAAVRQVCERVAVMYLGRVVEIGPRQQVFEDPRHPYTKALLAAAPRVRGASQPMARRLKGEPPTVADRPGGCPFHPRCPRAEALCTVELPQLLAAPVGSKRRAACHFREEG